MILYNIVYLLLFNTLNIALDYKKVVLKKMETCNLTEDYTIMLNTTIKTVDNKQYLTGVFKTDVPLDNTVQMKVAVNMVTRGFSNHLFDINEKKGCEAIHKYLGELSYELERKAGLIPGLCPIPKGKHELRDALLDFSKCPTVDNFPFGHLLLRGLFYDRTGKLLSCIVLEGEHQL